jgi:hypothetical protein
MMQLNIFLWVNFHHFANIKKAININKKIIYFLNITFFHILKKLYNSTMVLGFGTKIYKYFNKIVPPYMAYN